MPQIELMMADLPHTLYNHKKKDTVVVDDDAIRLQEEANRRMLERQNAQGQQSFSIDEIFAGAADNG